MSESDRRRVGESSFNNPCDRANRDLLSPALAIVIFLVYAAGACRTIYVGDSGELAAAAHTLGIPHPSGYPLYVLLGKLWTLALPVGSVAFRLSLFSAAAAALAVGLLARLARRGGLHPLAVATGALLIAFSPSFWSQANIQRVYTLNALFVAAATAVAFDWRREPRHTRLALAFFLCGLGASNHTFMAVYALALGLFVLVSQRGWRQWQRSLSALGVSVMSFAFGLLPYAFLPLRSRADPVLDWGNPESWPNFLDVVFRKGFWYRTWLQGWADVPVILLDYVQSLFLEFYGIAALLAVVGVAVGWKRRWPLSLPLLVMAANVTTLALHGSRNDLFVWHRYYIPSYIMVGLFAAIGCQTLLEKLPGRVRPVVLLLPLLACGLGWRDFDRSRYRLAEDYGRTLLESLPPYAHLGSRDDNVLFVLTYLHMVEGVRPDVELILQGMDTALPDLALNLDRNLLFTTHHANWPNDQIKLVPVGLAFQWLYADRPAPEPVVTRSALDGEHDTRVPKDFLSQNLLGYFHFMLGVTHEQRDWRRASHEFEQAAAAAPHHDVLFYNLGITYARNGLFAEALDAFERSHDINPRPMIGHKRSFAVDRMGEMRSAIRELKPLERELSQKLAGQNLGPYSPLFHERMADLLQARGKPVAALGHRRRSQAMSKSLK